MCECYQIDGPFMGADPNCPAHGDGGMHETIQKQAARIERLEKALRPFADALKGNWSHQPDYMTLTAGPHPYDLRLELKLSDFRDARAALEGK